MANHLKEMQEQKLEELKLALDREELQQYYNSHTYSETAEHYKITYGCSIKNLRLLYKYFGITMKGKGDNLSKNREKIKQGMLTKYGVDNPQKSKEIRERTELTNIERYGTKNAFQNTKVQAKQKETCLERYGVENAFQAAEVKEAIKQTCIERYGVDHISKCSEIVEKGKQTKLKRYGNCGYNNYEQTKQTKLKKYGEANFSNPVKTKQTCLERYGVDNIAKLRETHVKAAETRSNATASDGTKFDSSWEVLVYEHALQKGYKIETQVPLEYNDVQVTFIDFKINGQLYEVKGAHLLNNCWQEKGITIDSKLKCYKENDIIIITDLAQLTFIDPELTYIDIHSLSF
jgi:hypothetical protein